MTSKVRNKHTKEIQDVNFFEIIYKLRYYKSKIQNKEEEDNIEINLSEIMSYIFSNEILKDIFNNQLKIFSNCHIGQNDILHLIVCKEVQSITQKIYVENKIDYKSHKLYLIDFARLYFYPSILLTQVDSSKQIFMISHNIAEMYSTFDDRYSTIHLPENLEFYVSIVVAYRGLLGKYKHNEQRRKALISFLITSALYVLDKIQYIITNQITEECFRKRGFVILKEFEEQEKSYILTRRKDNNFYIDGKMFQLSSSLLYTFNEIVLGGILPTKINEKNNRKSAVSRINNVARKQIGQNILTYDKFQKRHILVENIHPKDFSSI